MIINILVGIGLLAILVILIFGVIVCWEMSTDEYNNDLFYFEKRKHYK